ncbi:MAG: tetratricopeptide repeat protein [Bacteroidetes bacterium]|nr:tetratricopeptide repeat protein [Bacteroidota bacterium]
MNSFNITVYTSNKAYQLGPCRKLSGRICILLLFIITSLNTFADNALQKKAEKFYAEKHYKEAIQSYEEIIKEGLISYKLYYNLGNAYYKNNELGKAIYYYELANKLQPNSRDVKANLRIANEKTIDKIESKENFFIGAIKSGLVNSLSTTGWAWLSIFSLIGSLILFFIFFISNQLLFKRIGFFFGALSFIVFVSSMVLGFTALNDKQELNFAIITNRESKIYEEPNRTSKSKFSLHEGTRVSVLETNPDWTNIKLENGNEGWIKTSDVGLF